MIMAQSDWGYFSPLVLPSSASSDRYVKGCVAAQALVRKHDLKLPLEKVRNKRIS